MRGIYFFFFFFFNLAKVVVLGRNNLNLIILLPQVCQSKHLTNTLKNLI